MSARKLPAPWRVEETVGGHYVVRDANGLRLAYVMLLKRNLRS